MLFLFALTANIIALAIVRADPTPLEPHSTTVENAGGRCHIGWKPDTTGFWKSMYIELMTGNNFNMTHLTSMSHICALCLLADSTLYSCGRG
jgi:hypothetical protein